MNKSVYYEYLKQIFLSGVEHVDPHTMIKRHLRREKNTLIIEYERDKLFLELSHYDRVIIVGAGKATAKMAKAMEEILGDRILDGVISVKYGHTEPVRSIRMIEAGHPVPDENSVMAALEIEKLSLATDKKTLVFNLISGGGSALLVSPIKFTAGREKFTLSLDHIQRTTDTLLSCGAQIEEINCIRKHISSIKGGKLARMMYPATLINFILSDVVGDRLDTIASGLTTFDDTTYKDALNIIEKYEIKNKIPAEVLQILEAGAKGRIEETPKKHDPLFKNVHNFLIGTNHTALLAAGKRAQQFGYNTAILSSRITGEARDAGKFYFAVAKDIQKHDLLISKPACVIGGGETTVTIKGAGKGGRNQELALSFLLEMQRYNEENEGIYFLSGATDGNDGPTDAAGAFASTDILKRSEELKLYGENYLKKNDSYTFFQRLGYLLVTGPTNTNVCDVQIALII